MAGAPFARLLANIVVMGSGVLGRAFVEAYKQALASVWPTVPARMANACITCAFVDLRYVSSRLIIDGGKAAAGAAKAGAGASAATMNEARMILNVKPKATPEEVVEAADRLVGMNDPAKGGSKYLNTIIGHARAALVKPPESSSEQNADAKPSGGEEAK